MIKELQLQLIPREASSHKAIKRTIHSELGLQGFQKIDYQILKKSIDARSRTIKVNIKVLAYINEHEIPFSTFKFQAQQVSSKKEIHIIGAGPAGLFAALRAIEKGLKPIIFERGKNVKERRRDLAKLNKEGILNEESNYCFGEGGAGTYSDGKLYTRSNKRGSVETVLNLFHFFGADDSILYEAHPHIGTNKLPQIIEAIREQIIAYGGEIHFNSKLTDIEFVNDAIHTIEINFEEKISVQQLILATGHSARDIYELLQKRNILIEQKPFALGVRIEHPQAIIDSIQYHCNIKEASLPPASYSIVEQINNRGVFSFCMCPGGIIATASTQQKQLVVNGWSPSKRNNPFANSGMVVSVDEKDFKSNLPLAGLAYQTKVESRAYEYGGGKFIAPAQRMTDFIENKFSQSLPNCSYIPGVNSVKLSEVLPEIVYTSLAKAMIKFGEKMPGKFGNEGYLTEEAIVVATESRTSSPVRIPRNPETLNHVQLKNLYPCAEGAGYAGGIVSAAMDGMRIVEQIATLNS